MTTTSRPSSLKALGLAIATSALLPTLARAEASEAQLNSIKLYNDVTIAQDTVTSWGPWTEFEAPAAGSPPLNLQIISTPDPYRTLPQVTTNTDSPLIGFGSLYALTTGADNPSDKIVGPQPIDITGTRVTASTSGSWLPDAFSLATTSFAGSPASTGTLSLQNGVYVGDTSTTYTNLQRIATSDAALDSDSNQAAFFQLVTYIKPADQRAPTVYGGPIVIGNRTSISDVAALVSGNVTASYSGYSFTNSGLVPVALSVNFGQSSWSGTWNNGQTNANGAVGFTAAGSISGANFSSAASSIRAADASSISGAVNGAFFGANAAAAGGVADITKNGVRTVDPFLTTKLPAVVATPAAVR